MRDSLVVVVVFWVFLIFFFLWGWGGGGYGVWFFSPDEEALVKFISPMSTFLFSYFQTHFWWQSEGKRSEPSMKITTPPQLFHCLLTFRRGRSEAGAMINKISFSATREEEDKAQALDVFILY